MAPPRRRSRALMPRRDEDFESYERRIEAEDARAQALGLMPGPRSYTATMREASSSQYLAAGDTLLIDPDAPLEDACLVVAALGTDTARPWTDLATWWEGIGESPRMDRSYWYPWLSARDWNERRNDGFRVVGRVVAIFQQVKEPSTPRSLLDTITGAPPELAVPEPR